MKNLKFVFPIFLGLLFLLNTNSLQAQNYDSAIGLRLGFPLSASYKKFLTESNAVEIYAGVRGYSTYNWVNISAAYQIHKPINGVDGLQWYFGGGASVFFWNFQDTFGPNNFSTTTFGLQGYLGLDYTFANAPISITADWVPTYFFNGFGSGFGGGYGSLGVRYTLSK